ncbi:MAG TPA: peptidase M19, partial [Bacillota bacterium]|nr:peptidase M19 [Bacillota bacterium]
EAAGSLQVGSFFLGVAAFPPPPVYPAGGNINTRPLQPLGVTFLREMMRRGMLIDIDHMGIVTKNGVFDTVESQHYPVISGHSGFTELAWRGAETSDLGKRPAESDLTPTLLARLQALGGMVSPITIAKDIRGWGSKVNPDLPGSAKTWAQSYLYALDHMGGANVGLGTDYGLVHGSGPRFGMKAAFVLKEDDTRKGLRAAFIQAQTNGVRYAEPIKDYREPRFQGPNQGDVYDSDQKEYWEAIALFQSGADPDHVAYPRPRTDRIKYLSRGMRAQNDAELATALTDLPLIPGDSPHEVRAGYYVRNSLTPRGGDDPRVTQIFNKLLPIWNKWQDMQGSNVPLHRCTMNCIVEADPAKPFVKDWDINLDGMAHYGLLPDFLQDLKNCGLDRDDLKPLFNSAEAYIRLWERCERARVTGP